MATSAPSTAGHLHEMDGPFLVLGRGRHRRHRPGFKHVGRLLDLGTMPSASSPALRAHLSEAERDRSLVPAGQAPGRPRRRGPREPPRGARGLTSEGTGIAAQLLRPGSPWRSIRVTGPRRPLAAVELLKTGGKRHRRRDLEARVERGADRVAFVTRACPRRKGAVSSRRTSSVKDSAAKDCGPTGAP